MKGQPASGFDELTPIRVLHVAGPMNHGGAEVMVMELLRHKSAATQIDFLVHQRVNDCGVEAVFDREIRGRGAKLLSIITPVQSGILRYFKSFRAIMAENGVPDVIHIHLNARSGVVVLAARMNGIRRIIVHSHAVLTFRGNLLYRIMANVELIISKFIFAVFVTDFWGCSIEANRSLYPPWVLRRRPAIVISNALDVDHYLNVDNDAVEKLRGVLTGKEDVLLLGNVGRIVRHKNIAFLVDVLAALAERGRRAILVIVGREVDSGYVFEMRARASQLHLSDSILFLGSRDDIPNLMACFDLFLGPALREGFGLVAAEAQAAGTPCVLSRGFPSSIDMGLDLVCFLDGFNAEDWARAILNMEGRRHYRDQHIRAAFRRAGFSALDNTKKVERAYRQCPGVDVKEL